MNIILIDNNRYNFPTRYIGDLIRNDTITDCINYNNNFIIAANRENACLYLIEFDFMNKKYNIVDKIDTIYNNIVFHADLIEIINNKIYATSFSHKVAEFEIMDNKLYFKKIIYLPYNYKFHGICKIDNNNFYLTDSDKGGIIIKYNLIENTHTSFILPKLENKKIKNISIINDDYFIVIACENSPFHESIFYKSLICLFKKYNNKIIHINSILIDNTHLDSCKYDGKYLYVTAQEQKNNLNGIIIKCEIINDKIIIINNISCCLFPHGLFIDNNYIYYTSYKDSSINILEKDKYIN